MIERFGKSLYNHFLFDFRSDQIFQGHICDHFGILFVFPQYAEYLLIIDHFFEYLRNQLYHPLRIRNYSS